MLGEARRLEDLGDLFGADLSQREVDYLVENEWARTADDILWRRTKLGLRIGANDKQRLETYLERRLNKGKK
jgi:glycerol-3-phosphate dehydrogenase